MSRPITQYGCLRSPSIAVLNPKPRASAHKLVGGRCDEAGRRAKPSVTPGAWNRTSCLNPGRSSGDTPTKNPTTTRIAGDGTIDELSQSQAPHFLIGFLLLFLFVLLLHSTSARFSLQFLKVITIYILRRISIIIIKHKYMAVPLPDSVALADVLPIPSFLMTVDRSSQLYQKRRRFTRIGLMEAEAAKAKLSAIKEKYGREIHVFETLASSPSSTEVSGTDEPDDFYEFTAEDYYRLMGTKKQDKFLKTKKIREKEAAAHRSRITKTTIRVRFPDNHTMEVTFHPSETIQSLIDILKSVVARSDLPFYLYTTPPKKQLKEMSQDFYSAGFVPGAIVYFSYDVPKGEEAVAVSGPFLQEEIIALKGVEVIAEQAEDIHSASEPAPANSASSPNPSESKPAEKKPAKPKWFKL